MHLPEKIFSGSDTIRYIYTGSGEKLATVASGSSTYYRSVMTYAKAHGDQHEQLLHIMQPEGLIVKSGSNWTYKYFKTDYLGNTRVLLSALNTADGVVMTPEQSTDYYPFGLAHEYNNLHQNRYLYSGKELQDASVGTNGLLGLYDFGSRYYDPVLGRWFNIDPALQLANPYLYCGNNPMMFTDPNGEFFFSLAVLNAICWGATIGAATYTASVAMSPGGFNNWNWGNFGMSVVIGGASGYVGGYARAHYSKLPKGLRLDLFLEWQTRGLMVAILQRAESWSKHLLTNPEALVLRAFLIKLIL